MNLLSKYRVSLLSVFLAVMSMVPAAQSQTQKTIARVNVPFAFECGSQHYPAGIYNISRLSNTVLVISGSSRTGLAMMRMDVNILPAKTGGAVFVVSGNQHFFHEIWSTGDTTHVTFYASKAERRVKLASNKVHKPDILLALLEVPR
jgi:hypothetical protein